jgi:hypothetical protein
MEIVQTQTFMDQTWYPMSQYIIRQLYLASNEIDSQSLQGYIQASRVTEYTEAFVEACMRLVDHVLSSTGIQVNVDDIVPFCATIVRLMLKALSDEQLSTSYYLNLLKKYSVYGDDIEHLTPKRLNCAELDILTRCDYRIFNIIDPTCF